MQAIKKFLFTPQNNDFKGFTFKDNKENKITGEIRILDNFPSENDATKFQEKIKIVEDQKDINSTNLIKKEDVSSIKQEKESNIGIQNIFQSFNQNLGENNTNNFIPNLFDFNKLIQNNTQNTIQNNMQITITGDSVNNNTMQIEKNDDEMNTITQNILNNPNFILSNENLKNEFLNFLQNAKLSNQFMNQPIPIQPQVQEYPQIPKARTKRKYTKKADEKKKSRKKSSGRKSKVEKEKEKETPILPVKTQDLSVFPAGNSSSVVENSNLNQNNPSIISNQLVDPNKTKVPDNNFLGINENLFGNLILNNVVKKKIRRERRKTCSRWSKSENDLLTKTIGELGEKNWKLIASRIKTKTADQCNQHWHRVINPKISKRPWDPSEDEAIKQRVLTFGESAWKKIAQALPGRTDIQCRHRWVMLRKVENESKNGASKKKRKRGYKKKSLDKINKFDMTNVFNPNFLSPNFLGNNLMSNDLLNAGILSNIGNNDVANLNQNISSGEMNDNKLINSTGNEINGNNNNLNSFNINPNVNNLNVGNRSNNTSPIDGNFNHFAVNMLGNENEYIYDGMNNNLNQMNMNQMNLINNGNNNNPFHVGNIAASLMNILKNKNMNPNLSNKDANNSENNLANMDEKLKENLALINSIINNQNPEDFVGEIDVEGLKKIRKFMSFKKDDKLNENILNSNFEMKDLNVVNSKNENDENNVNQNYLDPNVFFSPPKNEETKERENIPYSEVNVLNFDKNKILDTKVLNKNNPNEIPSNSNIFNICNNPISINNLDSNVDYVNTQITVSNNVPTVSSGEKKEDHNISTTVGEKKDEKNSN